MKTKPGINSILASDEVALMIGSNQGNRQEFFLNAKNLISKNTGVIISQSSLYESEAWGNENQATFLNQALIIKTTLSPVDLLKELLHIELLLGRSRSAKWAPRTIDIDILFYGNQVVQLQDLQIPHPRINDRKFTLIPLAELIPDFIHPLSLICIKQLNEQCIDNLSVVKVKTEEKIKRVL